MKYKEKCDLKWQFLHFGLHVIIVSGKDSTIRRSGRRLGLTIGRNKSLLAEIITPKQCLEINIISQVQWRKYYQSKLLKPTYPTLLPEHTQTFFIITTHVCQIVKHNGLGLFKVFNDDFNGKMFIIFTNTILFNVSYFCHNNHAKTVSPCSLLLRTLCTPSVKRPEVDLGYVIQLAQCHLGSTILTIEAITSKLWSLTTYTHNYYLGSLTQLCTSYS